MSPQIHLHTLVLYVVVVGVSVGEISKPQKIKKYLYGYIRLDTIMGKLEKMFCNLGLLALLQVKFEIFLNHWHLCYICE